MVDPPRVPFPGDPVGAADLVVLEQPPGQQPALAPRDAGDENLFHLSRPPGARRRTAGGADTRG